MQLSSSSLPIMVSVATGVLSSVLGKLPALVEKQCNKFKGVNEEILSMKTELQSMNALLLKLADMDDLDVQIKEWRNQIRELSYDIEDCIDNFIHRIDGGSSRVHKGFFQKSIHKLRTLGARNEIADQILKLKARVDNASERQKRYNFNGAISSSIDVVPLDPRLPALFAEADALVGIDEPTEALINWLTRGGEKLESRLSVESLVGFGGLGKTTLARQVYNKIGGQFDCQAFVSISQKPVSIQYDGRVDACRVHDVIFHLIISKSAEENFITVFGYQNHALGPQHKIRRLVDYHSPEEIMVPSNMNVLNVRSLTTYGSTENVLPLSDFQALRTISMECNDQLENHHLNGIGRLFRLKYLRLNRVSICKLPEQIGELQQLETIDLTQTMIKELPKSIVKLKRLMFLLADEVSLPSLLALRIWTKGVAPNEKLIIRDRGFLYLKQFVFYSIFFPIPRQSIESIVELRPTEARRARPCCASPALEST